MMLKREGNVTTREFGSLSYEETPINISLGSDCCCGDDADAAFRAGRIAQRSGSPRKQPKGLTQSARHAWQAGWEWQECHGKKQSKTTAG